MDVNVTSRARFIQKINDRFANSRQTSPVKVAGQGFSVEGLGFRGFTVYAFFEEKFGVQSSGLTVHGKRISCGFVWAAIA